MKKYIVIIAGIFLLPGCVAKRYLAQSQEQVASLRDDSTHLAHRVMDMQNNITELQNNISALKDSIGDLEQKVANLNNQNTQLGQLTADQRSKLTQSQRDLLAQQQRLQQLQDLLQQQKEQSDNLKNKMTEALKGLNSNDLSVYQKDGKVYVSLSENLLFP